MQNNARFPIRTLFVNGNASKRNLAYNGGLDLPKRPLLILMTRLATAPADVTELLEVFRIGLVNGLWDNQRVVSWADARVRAEDAPSEVVLDLAPSSHRSRNDLIGALGTYLECPRPPVAGRVVLGWLHRQHTAGAISLERVVRAMNWLHWHGALTETEGAFLAGVDDEYAVAVAGYRGPVAPAVEALGYYVRRFLACYEPLGLDNQPAWAGLVPAITGRVQALLHEQNLHNSRSAF